MWDVRRVQELFTTDDASAILATRVPQHVTRDRIAWSSSNDVYNVKSGYRFWSDQNVRNTVVTQSRGWSRLWKLSFSHKMKIFLWRFCRNNLPVRNRVKAKGVSLPILCPFCVTDVEHLFHLFFDCQFAQNCWRYMALVYDMSVVYYAPDWLLGKFVQFSMAFGTGGIWKIWDEKTITASVAMDNSFGHVKDWQKARARNEDRGSVQQQGDVKSRKKWKPPAENSYKVNVDASVFPGASVFTIEMVIRDHKGVFLEGKNLALPCPSSVFEAEYIGVREALSWMMSRQERKVVVETDSLLTVKTIQCSNGNLLEVDHVIDQCKAMLGILPEISVIHICKQANKLAHSLARLPCLVNCFTTFTSPPTHLLETILYDASS